MKYEFKPSDKVCCKKIEFEVDENNLVHNVKFTQGCNGNLKAIGKLVEGMDRDKVISILEGNICESRGISRGTSCADQFAKCLKETI